MLDQRLKLRHLQCFVETARLGSLSAAAQVMNISQPAASKTIRELEDLLAVQLFDRVGRGLVLTAAGRIFQQHAGAGLVELKRAQDLVRSAPRETSRLSIGALPTSATELLPKAALAFREAHPNCMLRVGTGPNWLLMSQLREGALDLVVGRMASAAVMEGLSFHQLYSERIAAIVRPRHALTQSQDSSRFADFPLVLPPPGAVIAPLVRGFLSRHGVAPFGHAFETVSLAFGRRLVQSSDAIWFISRGVVASELADGTLVELQLSEDLPGGPVGISMRQDGPMSTEQKGMVTALEAVCAQ